MIPKPIYELLPYVYIGGGLISLFGIESITGKLFGATLLTSGIIIQQMRVRYRAKRRPFMKSFARRKPNPRRTATTNRLR